ncbi:citrate synthase [Naumannella cuiyingiana]|uniref:citrate synthase (unknown stereospecificity) n=1 Tax=Naumannella cuiyingiana TaxID=1347891 RepID=A0A7Z0DAE8_9ACTN|nr:citrate synthase [Naumannella cuiyingiana]
MSDELISTQQAADLLGVRVSTVYAYVSRGLLHRVEDGRSRQDGSRFRRDEVSRLTERRHRPRRGVFEVTVDTAVTSLDPGGRLLFRGRDAGELAERGTFERVAELIWDEPAPRVPWPACPGAPVDAVAGYSRCDRIRLGILYAAATDPERDDLSAEHFRQAGRRAIATAIATLRGTTGRAVGEGQGDPILVEPTPVDPTLAEPTPTDPTLTEPTLADPTLAEPIPPGAVAAGTWAGLVARPPTPAQLRAVDIALGVLADHELATSTLAARAAASTGADPYLIMLTGASAMAGHRHGAASAPAYDLLSRELLDPVDVDTVPAGFGHTVYTGPDPRLEVLLAAVDRFAPDVVAAVDQLAARVARRHRIAPNVDLGLAALSIGAGLPRDAGSVIFTLARLAGFVAHGIEEQGKPLRFRPRATYTGQPETGTGGPT